MESCLLLYVCITSSCVLSLIVIETMWFRRYFACVVWIYVFLCATICGEMSFSVDSVKDSKGIKLVHVNARSLIHHFDELYISFLDRKFDIVIFTESWLHSNCSDSLISVEGYKHYRLDRCSKAPSGYTKRGGGIVVYIKSEFDVTTWPNLDNSDGDLELLNLSCKLGKHRKVNLSTVYRPPTGNVQKAIDKIESVIEGIRLNASGDIVIAGDFNVDLLSNDAHVRKLHQLSNSCRVEQIISEATRITQKSRTLLDHIYTDSSQVFQAGVINCNISDHLPVFLILKKARYKQQFKVVYGRSYR